MSAPITLAVDDVIELVEALTFLASLCALEVQPIDQALSNQVGPGYDARQLFDDLVRMAEPLAEHLGFEITGVDR